MRKSEPETFHKPLVLAVCGVKNSGKTTVLEQLVHILTEKNYRAAVVKHDGHDFAADVPGTDSYRMQQAGAYGTAVFSKDQVLVYKKKQTGMDKLLHCFAECDLILVEGCKDSELLKFEIVRQGISGEPVSNPAGRLGILTDIPGFFRENTNIFDLNDVPGLAEYIENIMEGRGVWEK